MCYLEDLLGKKAQQVKELGGVYQCSMLPFDELRKTLGLSCARKIQAIGPMVKDFSISKRTPLEKARTPEDVVAFIKAEYVNDDREIFKAILLDTKNGIRKIVTVAVGSLNAALVHPRELFKAAVAASAAGIILVHNHPTGNPEPSVEDTELTLRFVKCGELMGIELIDHIVIGGDRFVSMREHGLIV